MKIKVNTFDFILLSFFWLKYRWGVYLGSYKICLSPTKIKKMSNQTYQDLLQTFSAISLNQLNTQASLMNRIESKYLIHEQQLGDLLIELQQDFKILEIWGQKLFSYDNIYMDTMGLDFYHAHNNGDASRIKMRTRHYIESGLSYFEFKQKKWNVMRKFRYDINIANHGVLDTTAYAFINDVYSSLYEEDFGKIVFPSLKTRYKRCTLVHKEIAEKITIDLNVWFQQVRWSDETFEVPNLVIIEFKAEQKNSPTKAIFDRYGLVANKSCSKYCLGNYFLGNVQQYERFVPTIKTIQHIMTNTQNLKKPRRQLKKFQTTQLRKLIKK